MPLINKIDLFCAQNSITYTIVGGIAVIAHKINRTTQDIDVNILVQLEDLSVVYTKISKEFKPRFAESEKIFKENFILPVIEAEYQINIDFIAGLTEFGKNVFKRSKRMKIGEAKVTICSLEDLIIYKLFAS